MLVETEFTPVAAVVGGCMIGLAAVVMMAASGRILGVSGIVSRLMVPDTIRSMIERGAFVVGLIVAPLLYMFGTGNSVLQSVNTNIGLLIGAGLLVGFGSVLGGGCTSGHGVCGLGRFSVRSFVAAIVFTVAGMITVFVVRHMMGSL